MWEKSENFNSLRPILFELCKKKLQGEGQIDPPPAGIGLSRTSKVFSVDVEKKRTELWLSNTIVSSSGHVKLLL